MLRAIFVEAVPEPVVEHHLLAPQGVIRKIQVGSPQIIRCGEPYLREEVLAERLGEVVKAIQIDREKVEWIKEALRRSHQDEKITMTAS